MVYYLYEANSSKRYETGKKGAEMGVTAAIRYYKKGIPRYIVAIPMSLLQDNTSPIVGSHISWAYKRESHAQLRMVTENQYISQPSRPRDNSTIIHFYVNENQTQFVKDLLIKLSDMLDSSNFITLFHHQSFALYGIFSTVYKCSLRVFNCL